MRGQSMIFDAIFFLMLCGMAAAVLAWASSVYGNQALDAYKFMYLMDAQAGTIQTLSEISYDYQGNKFYWMDQFGRYLAGEFNESDDRFEYILNYWNKTCQVSGLPLVMYVTFEYDTKVCDKDDSPCAGKDNPLIFTCPMVEEKTYERTSAFEKVANYTYGEEWKNYYVDIGQRYKLSYAHMLFLQTGSPSKVKNTEPTYYASPKFTKLCYTNICFMHTKVYY